MSYEAGYTELCVKDFESSAALAPWREHIAWATRKATRQHDPADGPVSVALTFVMPRPQRAKPGTPATKRPDLDKLVRAVLDALVMGAAMRDDSQVTRIIATKRLAEPGEQPRVDILLNTESD